MVASIRPLTSAATRPFPSVPRGTHSTSRGPIPDFPRMPTRSCKAGRRVWLTPNLFALQIANALDVVARHHRKQGAVQRAPHDHQRSIPHGGLHGLVHRVIGHLRLTADQHRDARGMHREDQLRVEPVLLVVAAFLRQKYRPVRGSLGRVIDGDVPQLRDCGQSARGWRRKIRVFA